MTPTDALILIVVIALLVLGPLFITLSLAGWVLTDDDDRTRLGTALGHVCGAMGIFLLILVAFFGNRLIQGARSSIEPEWLDTGLRFVLAVAIVWCLVAALVAFPELIRRFRERRLSL